MKKILGIFLFLLIAGSSQAQWEILEEDLGDGACKHSQIVVDQEGIVYVAYQVYSYSTGAFELRVKKYDGDSWQEITTNYLSLGGEYRSSLKVHPDGSLYLLFVDEEISSGNSTGKASCMKYDGNDWEYVGPRGFSIADINYPELDFDSDGQIWAGFKERDADAGLYDASVMKFNGSEWTFIGERGIVSAYYGCAFVLDNDDMPWVAGSDFDNGKKLRIFNYNGSEWVEPDPGVQSEAEVFGIQMRCNSQNVVHVAFTEFDASGGTDDRAKVKYWNEESWVLLGGNVSDGAGYYPKIEFNNNDDLFMAYQDYFYGPAPAGVKVWGGIGWQYIGQPDFHSVRAEYIDLTLDQNQMPWISYSNVFTSYKLIIAQYVQPVGISTLAENTLCLSPNPAQDYILLQSDFDMNNIKIYNSLGKQVYANSLSLQEISIDVSSFKAGLYVLCYERNGVLLTEKVVVK